MDKSTKEYLDGIRRTIAESKRLVESAKLRFAETDRLLAESGTTREEVRNFKFTQEQLRAVNDELRRRGMQPLEEQSFDRETAAIASPRIGAEDVHEDMDNRRRKFGAMMKQFRM